MKKTFLFIPLLIGGVLLIVLSLRGTGQESPKDATPETTAPATTNAVMDDRPDGPPPFPPDLPPPDRFDPGRMRGRGPGPHGDFPPPGIRPFGRRPGGPNDPGFGGPGRRSMMRDNPFDQDRILQLRRENPELADLLEKIQRIRYKIDSIASQGSKNQDEAEQNRIKKKLQPLLEEEFDLDSQRQNIEIDLMEKRIQQLRNTLQRRGEQRARILEMKLDQLISNPPPQPPEQPADASVPSATPQP